MSAPSREDLLLRRADATRKPEERTRDEILDELEHALNTGDSLSVEFSRLRLAFFDSRAARTARKARTAPVPPSLSVIRGGKADDDAR